MRLMSAAPRLVAANWRSSATDLGALPRNHLERAQSFAVGEGLRVTEFLAFFQRLKMLRRRDQNGRHNRSSVIQNATFKMQGPALVDAQCLSQW